jgi:hypothetical protein
VSKISQAPLNEVLSFLKTWKERKEVEKQFNLSNTQSYHLINWMKKARLVDELCEKAKNRGGLVWTYKTKKGIK